MIDKFVRCAGALLIGLSISGLPDWGHAEPRGRSREAREEARARELERERSKAGREGARVEDRKTFYDQSAKPKSAAELGNLPSPITPNVKPKEDGGGRGKAKTPGKS